MAEPMSCTAPEEPQIWQLIQNLALPPWLPDGWTAECQIQMDGHEDSFYTDPVSLRRFRSMVEVNLFLETGKKNRLQGSLMSKRSCAMHKSQEFLDTGKSSRPRRFADEQEKPCHKPQEFLSNGGACASLVFREAPQTFPSIARLIVRLAPPCWLPDGWTLERRTLMDGSEVDYYEDPVYHCRFRSEAEVIYFLEKEKLCHELQGLGRNLCQQAVRVLRKEDWKRHTLQRVSMGLRTSMIHWQNGGLNTHFNSVSSPGIGPTFCTYSGNPKQGQLKKIRKENRQIKRVRKFYYYDPLGHSR